MAARAPRAWPITRGTPHPPGARPGM